MKQVTSLLVIGGLVAAAVYFMKQQTANAAAAPVSTGLPIIPPNPDLNTDMGGDDFGYVGGDQYGQWGS